MSSCCTARASSSAIGVTAFDEQLGDGAIDTVADDALTGRTTKVATASVTHVGGHEFPAAGVVAHVHTAAAQAAHRTALQQGGTLPGRALRSTPVDRLGVFLQALLVALVFLPRDVPRMGVFDEHLPLAFGQELMSGAAIGLLAPAAAPVGVGPGVPRVVQGPGRATHR